MIDETKIMQYADGTLPEDEKETVKKAIENELKAAAQSDLDKLDELKVDIAADQEMLADIALNMYVKEETVEIIDEYDQAWYPEFKVAFKKL